MLFNSGQFLLFFPAVILLYYIIPAKHSIARRVFLLAASYYFYMCWNARYGLLILGATAVTYAAARLLSKTESPRKKKHIMTGGLCIIFAALAYFKYTNFLLENAERLLQSISPGASVPRFDILLPVGISFFTFQAAGYLIDVYRGQTPAETDFVRYALFVSFFPQLVAGPIERSRNLLGQLDCTNRFDYDRLRTGFLMMLQGYFMKIVIADRASVFVDTVFGSPDNLAGSLYIAAVTVFTFQIYCDFCGYSLIAIGAARILGVDLMQNFNAPYHGISVRDYWRRWHISLSTWFRDYVYIPLGGSRGGKVKYYRNLMITFLLSGLWHGASWNYVVWGGLNGFYQVLEGLTDSFLHGKTGQKPDPARMGTGRKLFGTIRTFLAIDFAFIFFRARGLKDAFRILHQIFRSPQWAAVSAPGLYEYGLGRPDWILLILSLVLLMALDSVLNRGKDPADLVLNRPLPVRIILYALCITLILLFGIWGNAYDAHSFIYFQF